MITMGGRPAPTDGDGPAGEERSTFVASLAMGLASAGWASEEAVPELVAAADGDRVVLDAARSRVAHGSRAGRSLTIRAATLLDQARQMIDPVSPIEVES